MIAGLWHRLAHILRLNSCAGIIDHAAPGHDFLRPSTWRMGVRCVTCAEEEWFD